MDFGEGVHGLEFCLVGDRASLLDVLVFECPVFVALVHLYPAVVHEGHFLDSGQDSSLRDFYADLCERGLQC